MTENGGKTEWPQSLKDFANRTFKASNDMNRSAVQEELRGVIYKAFVDGTINTTDWEHMELVSLGGKRQNKKRPALSGASEVLTAEREKKDKRARRFDREKAEFDEGEQQNWAIPHAAGVRPLMNGGAGAGRLLANRLGGTASVPIAQNQQQQQQQQGWQYDFTGGAGAAARGGIGGMHVPASSMPRLVGGMNAAVFADAAVDPNVIDWDQDTVVGLSTKLEKSYLRLTSAPDPRNVRTLATLMQTLDLLKQKWRTEAKYSYICDQFKSMRQDLTVQRIKNDFTVKVYEIHARIALEKGDLGEYNQCQSQLRGLYALGLKGSVVEFLAYRILYLLHTRNRRDVNALMAELTPEHKKEPAIRHALAVRSALANGNYHAFFRLYDESPNMNGYIIDHFLSRERINALLVLARCMRPSLSLSFLSTELAFTDVQHAHDFLDQHQAAVYVAAPTKSAAAPAAASALTKKGKRPPAAPPVLPAFELRNWDAKAGLNALEVAKSKFRTIDIKGQV